MFSMVVHKWRHTECVGWIIVTSFIDDPECKNAYREIVSIKQEFSQ